MPAPTPAGFLAFIRDIMQVPVSVLPDNAPVIGLCYRLAIALVNVQIMIEPDLYEIAVYNLGGSNLINYAPDIPGATPPPANAATYWSDLRKQFNTYGFVGGIITSSSDEGTSASMTLPSFMTELTLANLQLLKDPYGQRYLQIAQSIGTLWGLS